VIQKIVLKHNVHRKNYQREWRKAGINIWCSFRNSFWNRVFKKRRSKHKLYIYFSLERGRLKIEKPFAHVQKVRIYLYRLSAKYSLGDLIIFNTRVKCQLSSARDTASFNLASPLIISIAKHVSLVKLLLQYNDSLVSSFISTSRRAKLYKLQKSISALLCNYEDEINQM
jgi:hypothetical protein